jgi:uncharacterized FlaG/YvyC family protein
MEIRAIAPTNPPAPAAAPAPEAKPPRTVERNLQSTSGAAAEAVLAPRIAQTHVELAFDATINRVVGRVVDETTGETILDIPPEQLKALYSKMREQLGPLVDETA